VVAAVGRFGCQKLALVMVAVAGPFAFLQPALVMLLLQDWDAEKTGAAAGRAEEMGLVQKIACAAAVNIPQIGRTQGLEVEDRAGVDDRVL